MADEKKSAGQEMSEQEVKDTLKTMDLDEFEAHVEKGEITLPRQKEPEIEDLYTPENVDKFIMGEITWAQLQGMTMDEAYKIAEYGYSLYDEGKFHDARTVFEALVLCNPYDSYFHNLLGASYQQLDMPEEALESYGNAIEMDDENLHAYVNRGELLLQRGEFDRALDDLQKAIDLDPDGNDPAGVRAQALAQATANAMQALAKAVQEAEKAGTLEQARAAIEQAKGVPKKD